jgi:hypothetical protein
MSSLFAGWKTSENRSADAWRRIQDKPTTITLKRGTTKLDPQTVRVEFSSGASEQRGEASVPSFLSVTIFGVKDHPSVSDTDIQKGDRVVLENTEYEVVGVIASIGEMQGFCEARQS